MSLHYVLPRPDWNSFRARQKKRTGMLACSHPAKANQLHEEWMFDDSQHLKKLTKLVFLCPRCHGQTNEGWLPVGRFNLADFSEGRVDFSAPDTWAGGALRRKSYFAGAKLADEQTAFVRAVESLAADLGHVLKFPAALRPYVVDLSLLNRHGLTEEEHREMEKRFASWAEETVDGLRTRLLTPSESIEIFEHDQRVDPANWSRVAFCLRKSGLFSFWPESA